MDTGGVREDTALAKEQSWAETESRLAIGNGVPVTDTGEGGLNGRGHFG